jgi:hypothetical protein
MPTCSAWPATVAPIVGNRGVQNVKSTFAEPAEFFHAIPGSPVRHEMPLDADAEVVRESSCDWMNPCPSPISTLVRIGATRINRLRIELKIKQSLPGRVHLRGRSAQDVR